MLPLALLLISLVGLFCGRQTNAADVSAAMPTDCTHLDFKTTGRPFFFPADRGIAFGISSLQRKFKRGEATPLVVWVNNQTDHDFIFMTCSTFWNWNIDVYDGTGSRLLSKDEQEARIGLKRGPLKCFLNSDIHVSSHGCLTPGPVLIDLNSVYDLVPGRYTITERRLPAQAKEWKRTVRAPEEGLEIQIDEP